MELKIEKEEAKRLYVDSPEWLKAKMIKTFGKDTFVPKEWERIKTPEDACNVLGINIGDVTNENDTTDEKAYKLLKVVIKSVQPNWVPDWNNTDQRKWWAWFNLSSGFGFSRTCYGYGYTGTLVGSRLCFETSEKCEYVANQFGYLFEQFLTLK
jgi:hypothetical protein